MVLQLKCCRSTVDSSGNVYRFLRCHGTYVWTFECTGFVLKPEESVLIRHGQLGSCWSFQRIFECVDLLDYRQCFYSSVCRLCTRGNSEWFMRVGLRSTKRAIYFQNRFVLTRRPYLGLSHNMKMENISESGTNQQKPSHDSVDVDAKSELDKK